MACTGVSPMMNDRDVQTVTATKHIKKSGNALVVYLTNELKLMGLKEGEPIEIIIKKVEE